MTRAPTPVALRRHWEKTSPAVCPREALRPITILHPTSLGLMRLEARAIDARHAEIKILGTDVWDGAKLVAQWVGKPTGITSPPGLRLHGVEPCGEVALDQPAVHKVWHS